MKTNICILISLCSICLWSCGEIDNRGIESREVAAEIRSREVKHITQAQITEGSMKDGSYLADTVQQIHTRTMLDAVQKLNLIEAAKYCNLEQINAVTSLEKNYQATLQRIRLKGRKAGQQLNEMETQLLDAYQYNVENKLPLEKNVQKSGSAYMLFTAPITINHQVCLKCHGKIGEDIDQNDYGQLRSAYDIDSLVNYSVNQPLGILSIMLQKKGLIQRISFR